MIITQRRLDIGKATAEYVLLLQFYPQRVVCTQRVKEYFVENEREVLRWNFQVLKPLAFP